MYNTGRKVVAASATAEPLTTTNNLVNWVIVQAETDNTGVIAVGGSGVVAALATRQGIALNAGESVYLPCRNLRAVWLDTTVNGDGVNYIYGT